MNNTPANFASLQEWIAAESIPFSFGDLTSVRSAVDALVAALGESVQVLGFGEPTHQVEAFLTLRNVVFQQLVERHGYTAIAVESSFPRGRLVNEYVQNRGPASFDEIMERGFSHGFGASQANRELVEWMCRYNSEHAERPLRFDGFDAPCEMMYTDSPRALLHFVLDYLALVSDPQVEVRRKRIDELLGDDAAWQNEQAAFDPAKSIGLSAEAKSLDLEARKLNAELRKRRAELIERSGEASFEAAIENLRLARQLLTYHAIVATPGENRFVDMLGQRDLMMADNLVYISKREQIRGGKVLAFAHNSHLKLGKAEWQFGEQLMSWWPAGPHVRAVLGSAYSVVGVGVGTLAAHKLGEPEPGTLEALLCADDSSKFVPTHLGQGLPTAEIAAVLTRTANPQYFPFTAKSFSDFDAVGILRNID